MKFGLMHSYEFGLMHAPRLMLYSDIIQKGTNNNYYKDENIWSP